MKKERWIKKNFQNLEGNWRIKGNKTLFHGRITSSLLLTRGLVKANEEGIMKSLIVFFATCLLLIGCGKNKPVEPEKSLRNLSLSSLNDVITIGTKNGRTTYNLLCTYDGRTLDKCYRKSGEICPNGYYIISQTSILVDNTMVNRLSIECKE